MEEKDKKKEAVLKDIIEAPVNRKEIDSLKQLTESSEIKYASGDILENHVKDYENSKLGKGSDSATYYHDLIFALIQIRLPEEEAKKDWEEVLRHKYTVSEKLGRNIGIHVAILDFYTNIKKYLNAPKIVEADEYVDTASHAMTDELTKAYNRRYFNTEMSRLLKYCEAFEKSFTLALIDIDHFKIYNDNNGHVNGDIALIETVRILHAVASSGAVVCRYGGEEFAIIFPDRDINSATEVMESVRKSVAEYRFVNEERQPGGSLTISVGVAEYCINYSSENELIKKADKMLYKAKECGRNRVETDWQGCEK